MRTKGKAPGKAVNLRQIRPAIGDLRHIAGVFDHVDPGCGLRGWLVHPKIPALPLRVEAWCLKERLATSVTVLERPDLDEVLRRNTWCGFLIGWSRFDRNALQRIATETPEAEIELRAAGSGERLTATFGMLTAHDALKMLVGAPRGDHRPEFATLNTWLEIEASGLFDPYWYFRQYGEDTERNRPALLHYIQTGEALGNRPNLYFDPAFYAAQVGIGAEDSALLHYLRRQHGTRKLPSVHFDNGWYRKTSGVGTTIAALAHYLNRRPRHAPNGTVNPEWLQQKSNAEDPYETLLRGLPKAGAKRRDELAETDAGKAILQDADRLFGTASQAPAAKVAKVAPPAAVSPLPELTTLQDLVLLPLVAGDPVSDAAEALRQNDIPAAALTLTKALGVLTSPPLRAQILEWVHLEWKPDTRRALAPLLRALRDCGLHDGQSILRILEVAVDDRDVIAASAAAEDLQRHYPEAETGWALITLARLMQLQGEPHRGLSHLRRIAAAADDRLMGVAIALMIEMGDLDLARERLALRARSAAPEMIQARLRLAVLDADFAGLRRLLTGDLSALPSWVLCEAAYRIVRPGTVPGAEQIAVEALLLGVLSTRPDENTLMARLHLLLQRKRLDDLAALFAEVAAGPHAGSTNITLRRLEFLGLTGRTAEALELYRARLSDVTLGKWEGMSVLRLLSEVKQWAEAGALVLNHIAQGFGFAGAAHGAMRVVRKAALHEKIADLVSSGRIKTPEAELRRFLALVQEDHTLVQSARALGGQGMVPARSMRGMNGNWILSDGFVSDDESRCLFLCTNRRYFLSLLTYLCSFFGQSQQTSAQVFVFLDRDVPRSWHATISMVAARFNRMIEVVQEDSFMPRGVEHKAEYGFFAGGSGLSRAAYFRIYAARHLMATNRFTRALYVDTDIVCRGDLTDLIALDLHGAVLAARVEDYGPEVIAAAERNGIDPNLYFNSGVMVFDFAHENLGEHLNHAIRLSETESDRLMFHDQCALNIAFRGKFQPLQPAWNFFLRPHRERNGHIEDGVLLHYLDKPKPWDIVFSRSYREEWRVWAVHLALILPQATYIDIFAAANEE